MSDETTTAPVSPADAIVATPKADAPTTVDTEVVAPQEDPDFAARFAALARKEKMLRDQEEKYKKYAGYEDLETSAKENPLAVLEKYGIDLDAVLSASLGEDAPAPSVEDEIRKIREEFQSYKDGIEETATTAKEAEEKAYQDSIDEAIITHKAQITDHIGQNSEKYELISLQGAEELVWEVTEAHYDANGGEILTPEQAADKVEHYLETQVRKALELSRFSEMKKPETVEYNFETIPVAPRQESPTLSDTMSAVSQPKPTSKNLTDDESKALAAKLLSWKA